MDRSGTSLPGGWWIDAELARGGMGVVWRGHRIEDALPVAIKVLRAGTRAAIEPEVRAVAALDHPNVVRVLDLGVTADGSPFFVMELASGDLRPWRPVSRQPPTRRDLSLALDEPADPELIGDAIRALLGDDADCVEDVRLLSQTPAAALPAAAIARMGMRRGQINVLLRLTLRRPSRALTREEANALRDRVYLGLHRGARRELT